MRFCKTPVAIQSLLLLLSLSLFSCGKEPPLSAPSAPSTGQNSPKQIAPGFNVAFLQDMRDRTSFVALDSPKMVPAEHAVFLRPDEYVLGITEGNESRAYPIRFLTFHHVINDAIGTPPRPVALAYCEVCKVGIRYDPVVQGQTLKFDFLGVYNGVATLCERRTQGVFLLEEGRIVTGPLSGTHLTAGSALDTTWRVWKQLHPTTLVMAPRSPYISSYDPPAPTTKREETRFPTAAFQSSVTRIDRRLPAFTMALVVTLPGGADTRPSLHRAYPLKALQQSGNVANDKLEDLPVGVLLEPRTQTAAAFSRRLDAQTLTLEARRQSDGATAFVDRETGTHWDLEGRGTEGPLAGKKLERLDNHLSQWYGWAASFPDTSIYGRTDPPQTKNLSP